MTHDEQDPLEQAQHALVVWYSTRPDATFAEIEQAVEEQIDQIRVQLLDDRTGTRAGEGAPICPHCSATMKMQTRRRRKVVLKGDRTLDLTRERQRTARRDRQADRERQRAAMTEPAPEPTVTKERVKTIIDGKPTKDHPWKDRLVVAAAS